MIDWQRPQPRRTSLRKEANRLAGWAVAFFALGFGLLLILEAAKTISEVLL